MHIFVGVKKALAAAVTDNSGKISANDKFVSGLVIGGTLIFYGVIMAILIATKDWDTLAKVVVYGVITVLERSFSKLKKKTKSTFKKRIINVVSILIYAAVIVSAAFMTELF